MRSYELQMDEKDERIHHYKSKYLATGSSRLGMIIKIGVSFHMIKMMVKFYE